MTIVIAEAGVNHNGSEKLAFELIEAAYDAGAHIVKFQTFKANNLATHYANQALYQAKNTRKVESQLEMLKKLELSYESHHKLKKFSNKLGIEFLSTAFDIESLNFLVNDLGLKRLKIPSGELTNAPFLLQHSITGCNLILSTGMANLAEIESALEVIAYGLTYKSGNKINPYDFRSSYESRKGQEILKEKVCLLHCTTEYPAPLEEINLMAIETLNHAFGLPTGYSDHTLGINIAIAAAARGAAIIEKHLTLDRKMEGPDHKASLLPEEFKLMVEAIAEVNVALGDGIKKTSISEKKNIDVARKSLVAIKDIKKGEIFTVENLGIKRPGRGISPYRYWEKLDSIANKDYKKDDFLE